MLDAAWRITGAEIDHAEVARRPGDPAVLIADIKKARGVLDWRPRSSDLGSILAAAWLWHKAHPLGYRSGWPHRGKRSDSVCT